MAETTNVAIQQRSPEATPDRRIKAIREDIAAKRESISDTVDKLGNRIQASLNWREYVADYPVLAIGLAAGAGFLLAGLFKRRLTPQERMLDALSDLTEDMVDRLSDAMDGVIERRPVTRALQTALGLAASRAISSFVKEQFTSDQQDLSGSEPEGRQVSGSAGNPG